MEHRADLESFFDLNGLERKRLEFVYDSQSRRVQKEVFYRDTINNVWISQESRRFLYDGWNPLVELVSTGALYTVERTYLWGLDIAEQAGNPTRGESVGTLAGGVGGLLAIHSENAETTLLPTYDGHGSIMATVDAANGEYVAEYEYGPFGELLRATGPLAGENPFGYSTKYTDAESGLLYYGYRYYVPETGRWLNRDPIGERGGINLYNMINNNTINSIDILGLMVFSTVSECVKNAFLNDFYNRLGATIDSSRMLRKLEISLEDIEYRNSCFGVLETKPFGVSNRSYSSMTNALVKCASSRASGLFKRRVSDRVKEVAGDDFPAERLLDLAQKATEELAKGKTISVEVT